MSATLDENYHVGFGLLASVAKGSNMVFDQALIRNEAWLPTAITLHLQARALLVAGIRADVEYSLRPIQKVSNGRRAAAGSYGQCASGALTGFCYFCCSFCAAIWPAADFELLSWA